VYGLAMTAVFILARRKLGVEVVRRTAAVVKKLKCSERVKEATVFNVSSRRPSPARDLRVSSPKPHMRDHNHSSATASETGDETSATVLATGERESMVPTDSMHPETRLELAAPYEDRGEFARGGMGSIRAAWDRELGRYVAVKVISSRFATDEVVSRRFIQEARITGQLDHPNIVPVHALSTTPEGRPSLVMKRIEGQTFSRLLRSLGAPPWSTATFDEVLGIFLKVCDAVAFAHSRGVVHRDLKPQNVMVGAFGQVYVMDWGIALRLSDGLPVVPDEVAARGVMGTPMYMAPEQVMRGEKAITVRTDVFQLGAILYEIITGRPPFRGHDLFSTIGQVALGRIAPPEEVAPERAMPPSLVRIAMKALARDPADRYASALDLKRDVENFLRGEERFPTCTFAPGVKVIVEGQEGVAAYVILTGRCVASRGEGPTRAVLREMGPGDTFGETSVFTGSPCSATVEVTETLTVKVVTRESLNEGIGLNTWMGSFVRTLAERFRDVDQRLRALESKG
jgi:serine/threonine-protein kinase